MAKTENTKKLEKLLNRHFNRRNDFYCFECTIGWYGREIVDCIMYNCQREIYCYEIKQSKQDFYSKNSLTFIGNKNYFVMPLELYEQVKQDIPKDVGVYASIKRPVPFKDTEHESGFDSLLCVKNSRRVELRADKEVILSSMLRSLQNESNRIKEE